jgi:hypothetical protein
MKHIMSRELLKLVFVFVVRRKMANVKFEGDGNSFRHSAV